MTSELLEEYDRQKTLYDGFTKEIEQLITKLLTDREIRIHSVTSRTKTRSSFEKKSLPPSKYNVLLTLLTYVEYALRRISRMTLARSVL